MNSQTTQPQEQLPSFLKHFAKAFYLESFEGLSNYDKENNAESLKSHRESLTKYALKAVIGTQDEGMARDDYSFIYTCQALADAFEAMENELRQDIEKSKS
jgi:hypothetical protein